MKEFVVLADDPKEERLRRYEFTKDELYHYFGWFIERLKEGKFEGVWVGTLDNK